MILLEDLHLFFSILRYLIVGVVILLVTAMLRGYNIAIGRGYSEKDGNQNFAGFILNRNSELYVFIYILTLFTLNVHSF